jgi:type III pantothenate kinase
MLLVIDIGNSNLGVGLARDGSLIATRRAASDPRATPDQVEILLAALLRLEGVELSRDIVGGIACASTVPVLGAAVESIAERLGIRCITASAVTVPLAVRVDRPGEVGPDRLVNAYAAAHLYGAPAVVIDCGTATTLDAVDGDGAFVGGAIAPGLEVGLDALAARTARLPRIELRMPDRAIGRDTVTAIQSGAVLGHRAMIEGLLGRMRRDLAAGVGFPPHEVRAVMTGGLSALPWARTVEGIDVVEPLLTLRGLVAVHRALAGAEERSCPRARRPARRGPRWAPAPEAAWPAGSSPSGSPVRSPPSRRSTSFGCSRPKEPTW